MTAALAILAVVVALTILGRSSSAAGRWLRPLRTLLPSWRFFDAVTATPIADVRAVGEDGAAGPWRPLIPAPERGPLATLYAPRGNLLLACHAVLDQLIDELEEAGPITAEQAEGLVSYALLLNMVGQLGPAPARYQLRLVMRTIGGGGAISEEELFVSRVHAA